MQLKNLMLLPSSLSSYIFENACAPLQQQYAAYIVSLIAIASHVLETTAIAFGKSKQ